MLCVIALDDGHLGCLVDERCGEAAPEGGLTLTLRLLERHGFDALPTCADSSQRVDEGLDEVVPYAWKRFW